MRVVSQDGMMDVPYERYCFGLDYRNTCDVIAWDTLSSADDIVVMGYYNSEEKAMKAMEMLREKYLSRMEIDGGYDITNGHYVQPNFWVLPRVFQFPKDKEVEV